MLLELYQAETERIASEQTALLNEASVILKQGDSLSKLEQNGLLHTLQVLVENAIGKSKQWLKALNEPVPISAYNAFEVLARLQKINHQDLEQWNAVIGLRNRIVHEYMNIDMKLVYQLIIQQQYLFISDFLYQPIETKPIEK